MKKQQFGKGMQPKSSGGGGYCKKINVYRGCILFSFGQQYTVKWSYSHENYIQIYLFIDLYTVSSPIQKLN